MWAITGLVADAAAGVQALISAGGTDIKVLQVPEAKVGTTTGRVRSYPEAEPRKKRAGTRDGKRIQDHLAAMMKIGEPVHIETLRQGAVALGFSRVSVSPGLSAMKKYGFVKRDGDHWILIKRLPEPFASVYEPR